MSNVQNFNELFKVAKRQATPLKVAVSGPSGSGKTYSAILLALGLADGDADKVLVVDTENSATLYSHLAPYRCVKLDAPFEPERFIKVLDLAQQAGMKVVIFDSLTHEWAGEGGILQIHAALGGQFHNWAKVTPRHNAMLDAIKKANCHVVATMRKKIDYSIEDTGGKKIIRKVGLADIQREGAEYEFSLAFDVSIDHLASTSKDRTGLFMDRTPFKITATTGQELLAWSKGE